MHYQDELAGDNRTKGREKAVASKMKMLYRLKTWFHRKIQSASYNLSNSTGFTGIEFDLIKREKGLSLIQRSEKVI